MPAVAMAVPSLMPQPANKLNATLTLPQLPTKPHHHHSHYSSSLSTGLPSHSMRGHHGAYQTTFPPLVYSGNTSGKVKHNVLASHDFTLLPLFLSLVINVPFWATLSEPILSQSSSCSLHTHPQSPAKILTKHKNQSTMIIVLVNNNKH